ncbi:MAG TPA: M50 family metallopeptidase [Candidatus Binatia bacterium]|nr:M50 family metallopeptidase [Candidatus Binatia bacterium]
MESSAIPGDGTSDQLNKVAPLYSLIAGGAGFYWWLKWMHSEEIPFDHSNTYLTLATIVIVLIIIAAHECGHAAIGLALGMKLRAFMIGPFQWSIRSGKWQFHFDPRQILMDSGATGLVPAVVNFPRWAHVCTLLGGVFANAVTGTIALWLALTGDARATFQADGLLALFGAWSLLMGIINLVPFRSQIGYSDGAQIYQWAANGVWADFHRVFGVLGTTLVTPLRPRDYDIDAIVRVSQGITQGPYAPTLRLLAYWYFIDQGRIREAGEALTQVIDLYNNSAATVPAGLPPVLVFGAAYVLRNPEAARAWWKRSEDANPKRFDTEFWLAASALHWVNGNLDDAYQALSKADLLARKLPNAGAYEFERYCCSLLRHALDEVSTLA